MSGMKNFMLAKVGTTIPYYPKLNELTGSVTASILMMQLEYWFSKIKGDTFYKFLEPCQGNDGYKPGDSWVEELLFSKKEFRNAFAQIGRMYNSKKEYLESKDKFEGMYYLSYRDRIRGLTFYIRNHELVDKKLTEWVTKDEESEPTEVTKGDIRKIPKVTYGSNESEPTEVTKGNIGTEQKGLYGSAERGFPLSVDYIQETTTGNYIQESTTEDTHVCSDEHIPPTSKVAYAQIVEEYNQICKSLPKVQQISDKRKRAMRKMWEYVKGDLNILSTLFHKTESSNFLAGRVKEWQANFDWIMREDKAIAILEGQYDNTIVEPAQTSKGQVNAKTQRFNNIASHNWDFQELERLEREHVQRQLKT